MMETKGSRFSLLSSYMKCDKCGVTFYKRFRRKSCDDCAAAKKKVSQEKYYERKRWENK